MSAARHPRPKELEGVPLEEIMKKYVGRFKDKKPDWAAFEDAKTEGYKRAQHRTRTKWKSAFSCCKASSMSSLKTKAANVSRPGWGRGNAFPVLPESFTGTRMTRSNPSIFRSCSVAAGRTRWATPTMRFTSARTRTSKLSRQLAAARSHARRLRERD